MHQMMEMQFIGREKNKKKMKKKIDMNFE